MVEVGDQHDTAIDQGSHFGEQVAEGVLDPHHLQVRILCALVQHNLILSITRAEARAQPLEEVL